MSTPPNKDNREHSSNRRWQKWRTFFSVFGPGFITANVDNDAGGLATYSQVGAFFGMKLVWLFLPVTLLLIMVQEMVNRTGVVTGQGLSDLIRERFGVRVTFYLMLTLFFTNLGNVMAEFAGIASAGAVFGLPAYLVVPICAVFVWLLVLKSSYKSVEKIFLIACIFYLAYPITTAIIKPDAREVAMALVTPSWSFSKEYFVMAIGLVGTTIAPWMQFYQQASVAEKNIAIADYRYSKIDTVSGGVIVNLVAICIIVSCAYTLYPAGVRIENAADAAQALSPLAGRGSSILFAVGLWNASLFAASILPLSTAYSICEALGWESGVDKDFETAPQFYVLYTVIIVLGAIFVMIPGASLMKIMFWSQVVNGLILPLILVFILLLVKDPVVMGNHKTSNACSAVCWFAIGLLTLINLSYVVSLFWT